MQNQTTVIGGSDSSHCSVVLNYGGGRQTVAICILIAKGILPKPDVIVMADTSRENPMTWEYLEKWTRPMMREHGLEIEVASHDLATVDLYDNHGLTLMPVFTTTGKLSGYCSGEWKRRVVDRHLRSKGLNSGTRWIGMALDEKRRWIKLHNVTEGKWTTVCPLVDLMLNTESCLEIIRQFGWPEPHHSACWMCPHKSNAEWRVIRDQYPEKWQEAIEIDKEIRENDERGGVFLHHSRKPLGEADLGVEETKEHFRQCSLGMCFI
jgi:3'-phosphoadenosine 5'-phosphosulfate sulfotransferase (PAPS reductase)/FAD synthetase